MKGSNVTRWNELVKLSTVYCCFAKKKRNIEISARFSKFSITPYFLCPEWRLYWGFLRSQDSTFKSYNFPITIQYNTLTSVSFNTIELLGG